MGLRAAAGANNLPAMRSRLGLLASLLAGCPGGSGEPGDASAVVDAGLVHASFEPDLLAPDRADPGALAELLKAAPAPEPLRPTDPEGGTRVGTDTGLEPTEPPLVPPRPAAPSLHAGQLELQPLLSTPAIERAARAQIYWRLAQQCHGPDGAPLPPDAIRVSFHIRADGSVDPGSLSASATDVKYQAVTECVVRELSASAFRGPEATLHSSADVIMTWPSVD